MRFCLLCALLVLLSTAIASAAPCSDPDNFTPPPTLPNPEFVNAPSRPVTRNAAIPSAVRKTFAESFVGVNAENTGRATGVVVKNEGGEVVIISDAHVIFKDTCANGRWITRPDLKQKIEIISGGKRYPAKIRAYDTEADLLLLSFASREFPKIPVRFFYAPPHKGEAFYALSMYDEGDERAAELKGSKIRWNSASLIVLDGWVRLGFSGGCVVDMAGRCRGLIESIADDYAWTFFTPANVVWRFLHPITAVSVRK